MITIQKEKKHSKRGEFTINQRNSIANLERNSLIQRCQKVAQNLTKTNKGKHFFMFQNFFYSTAWNEQAWCTTNCETLPMETQLPSRNACINNNYDETTIYYMNS